MNAGDDFVSSPSDEEIIRCIRERYMAGVSVAIVLLGTSTWSKRFVDWEIAAAIGLPGHAPLPIVLFDLDPRSRSKTPLPPRLTAEGPPPTSRVNATQSQRALTRAVADAVAQGSRSAQPGRSRQDPLLRVDLR